MYKVAHNCQIYGLNDFYDKYFSHIKEGTFVEVGAYDGYNFSNTWGLADAGWTGLYVEPIPEFAQKCQENHKNNKITVVQEAMGDHADIVRMKVAGTLSTYDDLYANSDVWKSHYRKNNTITVRMETLDSLLNRYRINPGFELLVIDTEGSELKVLKGFDIKYWSPLMVIVEAHEHSPYKELTVLAPDINEYFSYDYDKIYSDAINNIYIRRE